MQSVTESLQKELCDGDADAESRYSREILQRVCSVQLFVFVMGLCVDMRCSAVAFVGLLTQLCLDD